MASDHEPFPDSVKDFVFDLHDAARRSFIPSEQQGLYANNFREITSKVCLCVCVGYFEILWCIGLFMVHWAFSAVNAMALVVIFILFGLLTIYLLLLLSLFGDILSVFSQHSMALPRSSLLRMRRRRTLPRTLQRTHPPPSPIRQTPHRPRSHRGMARLPRAIRPNPRRGTQRRRIT